LRRETLRRKTLRRETLRREREPESVLPVVAMWPESYPIRRPVRQEWDAERNVGSLEEPADTARHPRGTGAAPARNCALLRTFGTCVYCLAVGEKISGSQAVIRKQ